MTSGEFGLILMGFAQLLAVLCLVYLLWARGDDLED